MLGIPIVLLGSEFAEECLNVWGFHDGMTVLAECQKLFVT